MCSPSLADQESCARVLLYRGANKEAKNKLGQTPFQVNRDVSIIVFLLHRSINRVTSDDTSSNKDVPGHLFAVSDHVWSL